jgi:serine/threonine protein kinase
LKIKDEEYLFCNVVFRYKEILAMAKIVSAAQAFATEGERRAAEVLKRLPDDWIVICNKVLPTPQGHSFEIDFIVIGEHWVFLLDEKSWRGKLEGNEEYWVRADGLSEHSPLKKIDYVAKVLAGYLYQYLPILHHKGQCAHGAVLLSAATELPNIRDTRAPNGLFLLSDVCQRLIALDKQKGNPLFGQFRKHIEAALTGLSIRPAVPTRIGSYHVQDVTPLRPGVRLIDATLHGEPRQLMVYDLGSNPLEREELSKAYIHEFKILRELKATGLVAEVGDEFHWSDDFLVLPIIPFPEKPKPLNSYPLPETNDDLEQELRLATACFKGLEVLHEKGLVHRALGPEAIYILREGQNPKIAFTNFFAAREGTQTIAPLLDRRSLAFEDPYAHFNLAISYGYANTITDIFSLGLVFLARLARVPVSTIRTDVESDITFPDLQQRWPSLPVELTGELTKLFKKIMFADPQTSKLTAKEVAARFSELVRRPRTEVNTEVGTLILGKNFKIERVLGQGSTARTYLASYVEFPDLGLCVFKKFLHPELVLKQGKNEYKTLKDIRDRRKSKYIPDILEIYGSHSEVHIKMEYIPGSTLQALESEFPWPLDRWWTFGQDLMNAIEVLENEQLLHRDLKPENIILHEPGNYPVLIDFSAVVKIGATDHVSVAGSPLYLPPEAASATTPPVSSDRYAAGIVLFKMLTGLLPFEIQAGKRILRIPEQIQDEKTRRLAQVLLRVVSNNPAERPENIAQMRQALQNALLPPVEEEPPPLQDKINLWVESIRSLYRNSKSGNANNRGLDTEFVRETYVKTAANR